MGSSAVNVVAWFVPEERMGGLGSAPVCRGAHWVAQVLGVAGEVLGEGYAGELENAVYWAQLDAMRGLAPAAVA